MISLYLQRSSQNNLGMDKWGECSQRHGAVDNLQQSIRGCRVQAHDFPKLLSHEADVVMELFNFDLRAGGPVNKIGKPVHANLPDVLARAISHPENTIASKEGFKMTLGLDDHFPEEARIDGRLPSVVDKA